MTEEKKDDQTPKADDQQEKPEAPKNPEEGGEQTPPKADETDYRGKFSESARENQVISSKAKDLENRINNLTNIEDPTEEELTKEYPNWDFMSDGEREIAKSNIKTQRLNLRTQNMLLDQQEKEQKNEALRKVYSDFPDLSLKKAEFEAYIAKPTHKGVDPTVLAKAFLTDFAEEIADSKTPEPKPKNPNSALETGSGGAEAPATPTISDDEAEAIRKTDPKRYQDLIRKGIIK